MSWLLNYEPSNCFKGARRHFRRVLSQECTICNGNGREDIGRKETDNRARAGLPGSEQIQLWFVLMCCLGNLILHLPWSGDKVVTLKTRWSQPGCCLACFLTIINSSCAFWGWGGEGFMFLHLLKAAFSPEQIIYQLVIGTGLCHWCSTWQNWNHSGIPLWAWKVCYPLQPQSS